METRSPTDLPRQAIHSFEPTYEGWKRVPVGISVVGHDAGFEPTYEGWKP